MDLRYQKTEQSIRDAFIQLRMSKPIEKISIRELSELAVINKGTFYLHYHNVYDLSETLENELLEKLVSVIGRNNIRSAKQIVLELSEAFAAQQELFNILFSGSRISGAAGKLNAMIKKRVYETRPELLDRPEFDLRMTATIYGCVYAYAAYEGEKTDDVVACLAKYADECLSSRGISR